ncbi:MAG: hypothetical protein VXW38_17725 [Bacteroidota bacterium]|nr:hypothetical protein [Bacteroidota bacterium]
MMKRISLLAAALFVLNLSAKSTYDQRVFFGDQISWQKMLAPKMFPSKFVYAELVYQRKFGSDMLWVNGDNVSDELKSSIQKIKTSTEALDFLGNEGWELLTAVTRNFDGGFEIYFYLKKEIIP